jgi:hypothetical protein
MLLSVHTSSAATEAASAGELVLTPRDAAAPTVVGRDLVEGMPLGSDLGEVEFLVDGKGFRVEKVVSSHELALGPRGAPGVVEAEVRA